MQHRGHTVLWVALAAALSASLIDLAIHVGATSWARGTLIFPLLFAYCAARDTSPQRPSRDGLLPLVLGVALSLVAVGGGMARVGRPGIALAVIGLARLTGRPSLGVALLSIWWIPLPTQIIEALAPGLEAAAAHVAAQVATALGVASQIDARHAGAIWLVAPAGRLELFPSDAGLALAWSFAGLGWFVAVRRQAPLAAAARVALGWLVVALPLQLVALAIACAVTLLGAPARGRALLDHFPLVATLLAAGWAIRSQARAPRSSGVGVRSAMGAGA